RVERRQLVLGGALLGVGDVPLVLALLVVPVNALAEMDDVVGLEGLPRLLLELLAFLSLGAELFLVLLQLAGRHARGLLLLDLDAALGELGLDVGVNAAGLKDGTPDVKRVGSFSCHDGNYSRMLRQGS